MTPQTEDRRCRADVIFYLGDAMSKFSSQSWSIVARKKEFKDFLIRMGNERPGIARSVLKRILKNIPFPEQEPECRVRSKRSAEEAFEKRRAKKAKNEKIKEFGKTVYVTDHYRSVSVISVCWMDFNTDAAKNPGESRFVGQDDESEDEYRGNSLFVRQDDENKYRGDHPAEIKNLSAYTIEEGLSRGDPNIKIHFISMFAKIPHSGLKDGSRVLDACRNLKFEQVKVVLLNFFATSTKAFKPIPSIYDIQDPRKILSIIRELDGDIQVLKCHKAYAQTHLFAMVEAMKAEKYTTDYQYVLRKLAEEEFGIDALDKVVKRVEEYRKDYAYGQKWLEVAEYFGGTGVILIFILAGMLALSFCTTLSYANFTRTTCLGSMRKVDGL